MLCLQQASLSASFFQPWYSELDHTDNTRKYRPSLMRYHKARMQLVGLTGSDLEVSYSAGIHPINWVSHIHLFWISAH